MKFPAVALAATLALQTQAFAPASTSHPVSTARQRRSPSGTSSCSTTATFMAKLDFITSFRTEWISAALCTNQTPRTADVCLQLGCQDGRLVQYLPRTVQEIITSSVQADGQVEIGVRRQLKQQQERRNAATVTYVDQRADDLRETADESVDVVVSLQAAEVMMENGVDWKKSIREAARVLKPGGRLLFVEKLNLDGDEETYLDYVESLYTIDGEIPADAEGRVPLFDDVGYDEIDFVLTPHIAGVAIKSLNAGLSAAEIAKKESDMQKDRIADLSIEAYERGIKKRKKKKKKKSTSEMADAA